MLMTNRRLQLLEEVRWRGPPAGKQDKGCEVKGGSFCGGYSQINLHF